MKKKILIFLSLLIVITTDVFAKQIYVSDASSKCEGNSYFGYSPGWYTVDGSGNVVSGGSSNPNGGSGGYNDSGSIPGGSANGICSSGNIYENDCAFQCAVGQSEYLVDRLNSYCATWCTESDTFTYPGFVPEVEQGTKFTWTIGGQSKVLDTTIGSPIIRMKMDKLCVVAFDVYAWRSNYNAAKQTVDDFNNVVRSYGSSYAAKKKYNITRTCPNGYTLRGNMCYFYTSGAGGHYADMVTPYINQEFIGYTCHQAGSYYDLRGETCYLSASAQARAAQAAATVNKLTEDAVACSAYEGKPSFDACGTASVTYGDEKYGTSIELERVASSATASETSSSSANSSLPNQTLHLYPVTFSRSGYTYSVSGTNSLHFNEYKYRTYSSSAAWALPDYFYRYVLINGISILNHNESQDFSNSSGVNDYYGRYENYIDIGFPNFPVGFNSAVGSHDISLSFTFCSSSLFKGMNIGGDCLYNVTNCEDGQCGPGIGGGAGQGSTGFDVIYRVIDLDNPFPKVDGSGRLPGLNWSINSSYVDRYITHNRGVLTEEVYTKEPMYEITLTPSLIQEIRSYNKENDLNDYKLVCNNGQDCRSIYLRELIGNGHITGCGSEDSFDACSRIDGR